MKERQILFKGPMVRAILDGRKTQTRRVINPQPVGSAIPTWCGDTVRWDNSPSKPVRCPYGQPGDRLWVRETWQAIHVSVDPETGYGDDFWHSETIPKDSGGGYWSVVYAASDIQRDLSADDRGFPWRPSIHMPRWASRITLEIIAVHVERLQDISEADAEAEGVDFIRHFPDADETLTAIQLFAALWDSNPWVWAVEFRRVKA